MDARKKESDRIVCSLGSNWQPWRVPLTISILIKQADFFFRGTQGVTTSSLIANRASVSEACVAKSNDITASLAARALREIGKASLTT